MILGLMESAFAAVHSNNPDDWRAIQLAEGTSLSFRPGPDERPEGLEMQIWNNEEFLKDLKPGGEWKIANFTWTVEKENCPTAPSR